MVVGVAWYSRDEWERLRGMAADPEVLESTYEDWIRMATKSLGEMNAAGIFPEKVEINVDALASWCRERRRPLDASARASFASERLRLRHESPHRGLASNIALEQTRDLALLGLSSLSFCCSDVLATVGRILRA
jgi:hypothetical protein